ncbi:FtsK/SpoIIIE domain-containing protein [Micromonospora sp. CPCC 206061]|uniref:FtsK/SpoIIIE domain-containing protein n=1 Tax=Micromonospora sp. CPCC 206061 TaxID=3122410 RepID=UPI002FF2B94F
MTTHPNDGDGFDWRRAEDDIADVVDLDAARERRGGDDNPPPPAADGGDSRDNSRDDSRDDSDPPPLVDSVAAQRAPRFTLAAIRGAQRLPVLPGWLRSADELRDAARWVVSHYTHKMLFHGVRLPVYGGKLAFRVPVGAARLLAGTGRWVADTEGMPVRLAAVRREDAEQYLKLSRQRDARVRLRTLMLTAALLLGVPTVAVLAVLAPTWAKFAALCAAVVAFGYLGRPADRPLLGTAVVTSEAPKLTSEIVIRALGALGIAEINKAIGKGWGPRAFPAPITRDGPGWRAEVDLPYGVTVTDIIERRDRLASGLRRPLGCVWPEAAFEQHAGRLVLWVGDQDMNKARQPVWPLLKGGKANIFAPLPFGTDQRGRQVAILLMFANMLIGAMPRQGKTFALRVLLLAAALDPTVRMLVYELKGTGDLSSLEKVAHDYASGADDAAIEQTIEGLRWAHKELDKRAKTIRGLPKDICPENKVTPELAAKRSLGLFSLLISIDECQELFTHPVHGKEAEELCTAIIKRGPALGIMLVLATQRPDKDSLPTGISANVGIRFCLRVMGQVENDMVLGTSAYRNGVRATTFGPRDKGIGYLVGVADDAQIARSAYLDAPAAERIADRARAARAAAGTLSGYAAGDVAGTGTQTVTVNVLDDIAAVVPTGEAKVWCQTVAIRLAELRPDVYRGWDGERVTLALKPYNIKVGQTWGTDPDTGKGANRSGFERAHLIAAITERNRKRDVG